MPGATVPSFAVLQEQQEICVSECVSELSGWVTHFLSESIGVSLFPPKRATLAPIRCHPLVIRKPGENFYQERQQTHPFDRNGVLTENVTCLTGG